MSRHHPTPAGVEIRKRTIGDCTCGIPYGPDDPPPVPHEHRYECDWGTFRNAAADPRYQLDHLMITVPDVVVRLLNNGAEPAFRGDGTVSASVDVERSFMHLDTDGRRWTWELFEGRFVDKPHVRVLVGRWPD